MRRSWEPWEIDGFQNCIAKNMQAVKVELDAKVVMVFEQSHSLPISYLLGQLQGRRLAITSGKLISVQINSQRIETLDNKILRALTVCLQTLFCCCILMLYSPVISEPLWASGFNPITWPIWSLGPGLKSPLRPLNKWSSSIHTTLHLQDHIRWSASLTRKWLPCCIVSQLLGSARDYHCRAYLLKWELFPKPLSPHPTPT